MSIGRRAAAFDDGYPEPNERMPTLDTLRGIAIAAVVCFHGLGWVYFRYGSTLSPPVRFLFHAAALGFLGVHLFFVLSGFLITGILLDTCDSPQYYRTFYTRRALRILPLLLLVLVVLKLLGTIGWTYLLCAVLFVANFGARFTAGANFTSLWTLSVEEQFYLVWPTVVRKLQPRMLLALALSLVLLTPLVRWGVQYLPAPFSDPNSKTWDCLDFFGGGAALALAIRSRRLRPQLRRIFWMLLGAAGLAGAAYVAFARSGWSPQLAHALSLSPWALLFSAAVLGAFIRPALATSLPGRILAFLGYISYGLYLVHIIVQQNVEARWNVYGHEHVLRYVLLRFVVWTSLAVLVAWISRTTLEEFFLKKKPRQKKVSGKDFLDEGVAR